MSKDTKVSSERNREGPDYFGYYTRQVEELLSKDEDFLLFSSSKTSELSGKEYGDVRVENGHEVSPSLFSNGVGDGLSDFKRERLKALLLQGVNVLTPEVDEMLYPVVQTRGIQMQRKKKKILSGLSGAESKDDAGQSPCKKHRTSPFSSSASPCQLASPTDPRSDVAKKISSCCDDKETVNGTTGPEEPKGEESNFCSKLDTEKESREVNDDDHHRQFLIENDSSHVEEILKNFSEELSSKLGYMGQQLEELLDLVMSKCRPMTLPEKKQLQKMIKGLPPKNLDRVVELVERGRSAEKMSHDDIFVDLEKESNVTIWRLYYYVQAVEKARKLSR